MTRADHLDELRDCRRTMHDVHALIRAASVAEPVRLAFLWRPMLRDADDDMVLEAAINGKADAIVTFNRRDFAPASGPVRNQGSCRLERQSSSSERSSEKKRLRSWRLQPSLLEEARKLAETDQACALNQLINVAVAEKLSALRTETYFAERAARADIPKALKILKRAGTGQAADQGRRAATPEEAPRLVHHPHHGLDLDRDLVRQRAHADRRARVAPALAEHRDEQVGAAVDHLRLVGEFRHRVDHAEHLEHLDLVEAAARRLLRRREQPEADELGVLVGLLDGHVLSHFAADMRAVRPARSLPRQIDRVAVALPRHVVRDRRRDARQGQAELLQVLFGAHAACSSFLNFAESFGCHQRPPITTPSERMRLSPVMCSPVTSS